MTHHEAMQCFDEEEWDKAVHEELMSGEVGHLDGTSLLDLSAMASFEGRSSVGSPDMDQAMALWAAGWTSEVPSPEHDGKHGFWSRCSVMSFYWRRPPRRPGKPGRRYLSTNQAYNAMMKEQPK